MAKDIILIQAVPGGRLCKVPTTCPCCGDDQVMVTWDARKSGPDQIGFNCGVIWHPHKTKKLWAATERCQRPSPEVVCASVKPTVSRYVQPPPWCPHGPFLTQDAVSFFGGSDGSFEELGLEIALLGITKCPQGTVEITSRTLACRCNAWLRVACERIESADIKLGDRVRSAVAHLQPRYEQTWHVVYRIIRWGFRLASFPQERKNIEARLKVLKRK